jgi:hypothetical protein
VLPAAVLAQQHDLASAALPLNPPQLDAPALAKALTAAAVTVAVPGFGAPFFQGTSWLGAAVLALPLPGLGSVPLVLDMVPAPPLADAPPIFGVPGLILKFWLQPTGLATAPSIIAVPPFRRRQYYRPIVARLGGGRSSAAITGNAAAVQLTGQRGNAAVTGNAGALQVTGVRGNPDIQVTSDMHEGPYAGNAS